MPVDLNNGGQAAAQSVATLGGGCFWCVEAVYLRVAGVRSAVSGYAGGSDPNPTYEAVCSGRSRACRGGAGYLRPGRW